MKKFLLFSLVVIVFCSAQAKTFYTIKTYNGTLTGYNGDIANYSLIAGDSLMVKAWVIHGGIPGWIDSTSVRDWYVDSVYQFTAGGLVVFHQSGLITYQGSDDIIQLSIAIGINDANFSNLPFPFSQVSSPVNLNRLRYTVIDLLGNVLNEGIFSGKIILRDAQPENPLPPGIYYVIYFDALDNRQVVTDKVYVSK